MIRHLPLVLGHHLARHAVLAHAAHKTGAAIAGHSLSHAATEHAIAGGVAATKGAAITKVAAHGAIAKHLASGAAFAAIPKPPIVP